MISLIHSRNISSPSFKVNDSQIVNFQSSLLKSHPIDLPSTLHSPSHRLQESKSIPMSLNTSLISQNQILEGIQNSDDKDLLSLPSPKTKFIRSPAVSITNLYNPIESLPSVRQVKSPRSIPPISVRKFQSISPLQEDNSPGDCSPGGSTSYLACKSTFSSKKKKGHSVNNSISVNQDKFKQYLGYLEIGASPLNKEKFEKRLKAKFPNQNSKKSLDGSEYGPGSLYMFPPNAIIGPSVNLGSKDISHTNLENLRNHYQSRKSSIFQQRRRLQVSSNRSNASPDGSQDSITMIDSKNVTPNLSKMKKSSLAPNSKLYNFAYLNKQKVSKFRRPAEIDNLFNELAINLQDLYQILGNDKKMASVLEKLSLHNPTITGIILPKFHKVMDYDAIKLEQKFTLVELASESMSIPAKLQKLKEGVVFIDPSVIVELGLLNRKIEEFTILKKKEQLKVMEDRIIQSHKKLEELQQKKAITSKLRNGRKYNFAEKSINESVPYNSNYNVHNDPMAAMEEYQKKNGDFKHLNRKNLEHARGVNEIFSKWFQRNQYP